MAVSEFLGFERANRRIKELHSNTLLSFFPHVVHWGAANSCSLELGQQFTAKAQCPLSCRIHHLWRLRETPCLQVSQTFELALRCRLQTSTLLFSYLYVSSSESLCLIFCAVCMECLSGLLGLSWAQVEHSCLKVGVYSHVGILEHLEEFSKAAKVDALPDVPAAESSLKSPLTVIHM